MAANPPCTSTTTRPTRTRRSRSSPAATARARRFLDRLLRERRLVDLYRVVRESIRASTAVVLDQGHRDVLPRQARQGDVQTAGASIVYYERYLETGDKTLLEKIERYNEDDVESTQQLHEWLLELRPEDLRWRGCENDESVRPRMPPASCCRAQAALRPKLQAYLDQVDAVRRALLASTVPRPRR